MEADWSVELAGDDPAIVIPWFDVWSHVAGNVPDPPEPDTPDPPRLQFLDLRQDPAAIDRIAEARAEPALRSALLTLNDLRSRLCTAKCGLWKSGSEAGGAAEIASQIESQLESTTVAEVDPWEMDAEPGDAMFSAGCYIDIVPLDSEACVSFAVFAVMENWLRRLTERLRGVAMRCARTDFVLRRSEVRGVQGFAVTWFIEACGATPELAGLRRAEALARALPIVMEVVPGGASQPNAGTLQ